MSHLLLAAIILLSVCAEAFQLSTGEPTPDIVFRCGPNSVTILKMVKPVYPAEAKAKGIYGLVRIKAIISPDGVPTQLQVVSGPSELRAASLEAAKQWRYQPKPAEVETSIDIEFKMPAKDR